jgi:predicted transcriptional regulator
MTNFTVRLEPALRQRIERLATAERRPLGDWMRLALEEVADERELQARLTEQTNTTRRAR